ncbi:LytTR family DNA-binding domain-containing protein [Streptococcus suis]|uniref:LytTR family DNA-binding domain-containing protein n=1 Tax=Streptococcus sp. ZY1909104 TaxID=3233335 RepID=UPI000CF42A18|nr:response regulator transcription factor [Streptococcus suis]
MKVKVAISSEILEDLVTVEARKLTAQISSLVEMIETFGRQAERLTVKKGEEVHLLELSEIYRLYLENKILQIETRDAVYQSDLRLYQVKEVLSLDFLQVSQSEIINMRRLDHLKLTSNGLVKLVMKNGAVTYSSRRYLKVIKERLGL